MAGAGEAKKGKKSRRDDYPEELEDSEEEKEDYTIRKSDALIVAATAEDEHSNLERVYVYDHKTSDLYVHHEIILSSYPLCMEWLSSYGGKRTNLVIVGTFLPQIEIWNLDSEDCEPVYTLGGVVEEKQKKKKKALKAGI